MVLVITGGFDFTRSGNREGGGKDEDKMPQTENKTETVSKENRYA